MEKDLNPEIFGFEKSDIEMYITYNLKIKEKIMKSLNYLIDALGSTKYKDKLNLDKLKWSEGKSYDYKVINQDDIYLLFRRYQTHYTIYYKHKFRTTKYGAEYDDEYSTRYGIFTFDIDTEAMSDKDSDSYYDNSAKDLNKYLPVIFDVIRDNKAHAVWNPVFFKLPEEKGRPKYIKVKTVYGGGESISSIDLLIFAVEEIFQKYLEIFSHTTMLEKVKTLKKGDKLGSYTVVKTHTKVKDDYYHDAGITWKDEDKEEKFNDVYSLTRWHYEDVFNIKVEENEEQD